MKKSYFYFFFVVMLSVACTDDVGHNEDGVSNDTSKFLKYSDDKVVEGVMRVKLTPQTIETFNPVVTRAGVTSTGITLLDEAASKLGITKLKRVFPDGGRFDARRRKAGLHLWYDIEFDKSQSVTRAVQDLSIADGFEVVEPVFKVKSIGDSKPVVLTQEMADSIIKSRPQGPLAAKSKMNDPYLSLQWHYQNDGLIPGSKPGVDINLLRAWEIETGKPEVIVAVIDGGIQYDHPDLAANMWINKAEMAGDGIDNDGNGYIDDIYGYNFVIDSPEITQHYHGTHVAGTVGAVNNNGIGVSGVAGGNGSPESGVRLMSCQVFMEINGKDASSDNTEAAFVYAADNGAVIAQNSWGYMETLEDIPESMKEAIDYFIDNAGLDENGEQEGPMAGGVVIFSAGNEFTRFGVWPASYERVISVTAFGLDNMKTYYSNYGSWTDIAAPGGSPMWGMEGLIYSTYIDSDYAYLSGTSMACPHVSGVAALIVSRYGVGKKGFTNSSLIDKILSNTNVAYDPYYYIGVGYLNAQKALADYGKKTPDRVCDLNGDWTFEEVTLSWSICADARNDKVEIYEVLYAPMPLYDVDFNNPPEGVNKMEVIDDEEGNKVGEKMEVTITDMEEGVTYFFSVAGIDSEGNSSVPTTIYGEVTENRPPEVDVPRNIILKNAEVRDIDLYISDPEGYSWTYTLEAGSNALSAVRNENILVLHIDALAVLPGKYVARLMVEDEQGVSQSVLISYTISENNAPSLHRSFDRELIFTGPGERKTIILSNYFKDEDGDKLSYKIEVANPSVVVASQVSDGVVEFITTGLGASKINIIASDTRNEEVKTSFDIICRDTSRPVDLYPSPVKQDGILNIRMVDFEGTVEVIFYNMGGAKVFSEKKKITLSNPVTVDISSLSPGNYRTVVKYVNKEYKQTITKL